MIQIRLSLCVAFCLLCLLALPPSALGDDRVEVIRTPEGDHKMIVHTDSGPSELSPQQYAERLFDSQESKPVWMSILNITSPIGALWVAIGLFGQLLFTGRMLMQWLVSERAKRSVVPVGFWWMSLSGASMLLVYFVWRKDIVGVMGQSVGWLIYSRNLWLIYRPIGDHTIVGVTE